MDGAPQKLTLMLPMLLGFLLAPSALLSQSQITTGVIQGVITDESGGVLPGAKITLVQSATGFRRELISDDGGRFTALLMPLGAYRIRRRPALAMSLRAWLSAHRLPRPRSWFLSIGIDRHILDPWMRICASSVRT